MLGAISWNDVLCDAEFNVGIFAVIKATIQATKFTTMSELFVASSYLSALFFKLAWSVFTSHKGLSQCLQAV